MQDILIVTRHASLARYIIELLRERDLLDPIREPTVLARVTAREVRGRDVWGVLPLTLERLTHSYTRISYFYAEELRRKRGELTLEEIRVLAKPPVTRFNTNKVRTKVPQSTKSVSPCASNQRASFQGRRKQVSAILRGLRGPRDVSEDLALDFLIH